MRHADPDSLTHLEPLLAELRALSPLKEKKPGTFYRGSRAFLHFHEDPTGLFADVRLGQEWERARVTTQMEQKRLLRAVRASLAGTEGQG
jgi:hypothetical protein